MLYESWIVTSKSWHCDIISMWHHISTQATCDMLWTNRSCHMSLSCGWLQPHYRDGTPIPMHDYNNDIHQLYSAGCDGHCCWHCGKDSFWAEKLNKVSTIICIPPTSNPVIRISRQRLLFTDGLISPIVKISSQINLNFSINFVCQT